MTEHCKTAIMGKNHYKNKNKEKESPKAGKSVKSSKGKDVIESEISSRKYNNVPAPSTVNLTSRHEVAGSMPVLAHWVRDLALQ